MHSGKVPYLKSPSKLVTESNGSEVLDEPFP